MLSFGASHPIAVVRILAMFPVEGQAGSKRSRSLPQPAGAGSGAMTPPWPAG